MRKQIITGLLALALAFSITGCNEQVPAGHKGKILGKNGWQPEVFPPSKVWVETVFTTTPEQLFTMETTTSKYTQPIKVKLKDKLELKAVVIFTCRINTTKDSVVGALFNDMKMDDSVVTTEEVYTKYGKQIVLQTAREIISQYNVDEVHANYARINGQLKVALATKLKGLPISLSNATIGEIQYPAIVTKAINEAKERRMAIEKEEAQVQIELTKKKGAEELAKADYKIKMLEAKRIRDYNAMTAKGITSQLLTLRKLELREKALDVKLAEANKWDGKLPTTVMSSGTNPTPVIMSMTK